jgi:threonyl-tRNA synthetase
MFLGLMDLNQTFFFTSLERLYYNLPERFTGVLIEHFGGDFPTWLAPEQVRILTITDAENAYAGELLNKMKAEGIRATLDGDSDKLGAKIRKAETDKIP